MKFVKNNGNCFSPLTSLLKKNAFVWNEATELGLSSLKDAMCTTLVLVVPYFTKNFVFECDSLGRDMR
jgi:hypothetical protein